MGSSNSILNRLFNNQLTSTQPNPTATAAATAATADISDTSHTFDTTLPSTAGDGGVTRPTNNNTEVDRVPKSSFGQDFSKIKSTCFQYTVYTLAFISILTAGCSFSNFPLFKNDAPLASNFITWLIEGLLYKWTFLGSLGHEQSLVLCFAPCVFLMATYILLVSLGYRPDGDTLLRYCPLIITTCVVIVDSYTVHEQRYHSLLMVIRNRAVAARVGNIVPVDEELGVLAPQ